MFETHIVFQKGFYLPGIDKTGKVIVHVKCYTVDFRVWATAEQLAALKTFLVDNGVKYGKVPAK